MRNWTPMPLRRETIFDRVRALYWAAFHAQDWERFDRCDRILKRKRYGNVKRNHYVLL